MSLIISFENTVILGFIVFCTCWIVRIFIKWRVLGILKRIFALLIYLWIVIWLVLQRVMDLFTLERPKTESLFSCAITTFRVFSVFFIVRSSDLMWFSVFDCGKGLDGGKSRWILSNRLGIISMDWWEESIWVSWLWHSVLFLGIGSVNLHNSLSVNKLFPLLVSGNLVINQQQILEHFLLCSHQSVDIADVHIK